MSEYKAGPLLEQITVPADLREKIKEEELPQLCDELRQFIERFERLEMEKKDIADQQKEVMAEAKARGYDTKVMRKVIALRKREVDADTVGASTAGGRLALDEPAAVAAALGNHGIGLDVVGQCFRAFS